MIELLDIDLTIAEDTALEKKIFEGFSLRIETGEFVTLMGGNGAGKSSLIRMICGELRPSHGKILLDGIDVSALKPHQRARLISRVFQDPLAGSFPHMTIEENLSLALSRTKPRTLEYGCEPVRLELFKERLRELNMGLENRLNTPMGSISGGQRQAISLVMATLQPTKILLLDEHTAALDPRMRTLVLNLTRQIVEKYNLTTLMITHCLSQAFELGSRTLILHQGRILYDLRLNARGEFCKQDLLSIF